MKFVKYNQIILKWYIQQQQKALSSVIEPLKVVEKEISSEGQNPNWHLSFFFIPFQSRFKGRMANLHNVFTML